jgi:hypothetical protein
MSQSSWWCRWAVVGLLALAPLLTGCGPMGTGSTPRTDGTRPSAAGTGATEHGGSPGSGLLPPPHVPGEK